MRRPVGTGAASQALQADPNTVLVALADAFPEPVAKSLDSLQKQAAIADRVKVPPEKQFVGLDAYQKLIDSGVDVVLQGAAAGISSGACARRGYRRQTSIR